MKSPYPLYKSNNPLLEDSNQLDIFRDKPFWIWDEQEHSEQFKATGGKCCHVDLLGRPQKDGQDFPIFPYQKLIYDALENNMNIWILKSRGIGLTTFMIYYLTWKILRNNDLDHSNIFIISGTREAHANYIKEKMSKLFERNFPLLNLYTKYTEMVLKSTWIKVFPSLAIKDLRGYFSASYIWCDESDYLNDSVQEELVAAIQPYQIKSNCKIVLSSTPNKPMGLMQRIELDKDSNYYKLRLPYELGVDLIYNRKEIEEIKNHVEFKREFGLHYLGKVGNVFLPSQIQTCIDLGKEYSIDKIPVSLYTLKSVGIDPGFSSSATGIVVLEHIKPTAEMKDKIRVIETYNIEKGDPNQVTSICWSIWQRFNYMNTYFYIDGSNRAMVNLLKVRWDEPLTGWETKTTFGPNTKIRPVNFSTEHRNMLSNLHAMVSKSYLAIEEKHDKLLTSLRTAYAEELNLKKEQTSYSDLLDALRLALKGYNIK